MSNNGVLINNLFGSSSQPCLIVGEVAQAHDGSLGMAHAFIDAIAKAGANAIKFQTHIAAAESTLAEPWRVKFSQQDATRFDYWHRMEFSEEQWMGLKKHAEEKDLIFISSPFSNDAVDLLVRLGVSVWKLASGEITNGPMVAKIIQAKLPIIVSTGMSLLRETDALVEQIQKKSIPFAMLQCTSIYPCPPEKIGINMLSKYRQRYGCPVGISDHSGTIFPGLAAATLGAQVIEVHVTLSREMFGPDVPASISTSELFELVRGVRFIESMFVNPVEKDNMAQELNSLRKIFSKSVTAATDLSAGTILQREHLRIKKPGTGIPSDRLETCIGKRLNKSVPADHLFSEKDFE